MLSILSIACHCGKCINAVSKTTNYNDLRIAEVVCIAGAVSIITICLTIYLIARLNQKKKDASTKQIVKDFLKNDKDITTILRDKA